ncbi:MAG: hypothetical protein LQ343_006530 [Gyalolechia ehrenbergii]|nr:MAG: hypothetical protein LQ343_006530 [Gyalolechia ehrenbergii]
MPTGSTSRVQKRFRNSSTRRGHLQELVDTPHSQPQTKPKFAGIINQQPQQITKAIMLKHVKNILTSKVGSGWANSSNFSTVADLFGEQTLPWTGIVPEYIINFVRETQDFIDFVLARLLHKDKEMEPTISKLIHRLLGKVLGQCRQQLQDLLLPSSAGYPLMYNREFHATIHAKRQELLKMETIKRISAAASAVAWSDPGHMTITTVVPANVDVAQLADCIVSRSGAEQDEYTCLEVMLCMQGIYQVRTP